MLLSRYHGGRGVSHTGLTHPLGEGWTFSQAALFIQVGSPFSDSSMGLAARLADPTGPAYCSSRWLRERFEHRSETLALENEAPTGPRRPVLVALQRGNWPGAHARRPGSDLRAACLFVRGTARGYLEVRRAGVPARLSCIAGTDSLAVIAE